MKSLLWLSMIWFVGISSCLWISFWQPEQDTDSKFPFWKNPSATQNCDDLTSLWDCVDVKDDESIINRLLGVFNLDRVSQGDDHKFLNYVKAILNVALWLLSMVALIMTIYTFYLMFFTENDAGIKKAKWNLVKIEDYTWKVGYGERTWAKIETLISTQWFINIEPLAKKVIKWYKNKDFEIIPQRFTKTFEDWIFNLRDWCISRQLYWWHRIPVSSTEAG